VLRSPATGYFERVLADVDGIVTSTTARIAPAIRPDVMPHGESDLGLTSSMMRFVFPSNPPAGDALEQGARSIGA